MTSGMKYKQGEVVLVPFPFTNLSAVKQRPVLILSKDTSGDDVITCGITSNMSEKDNSITITQKNFSSGKLPKTSLIKVDKLFTLEKRIIKKTFGQITPQTLTEVTEMFRGLV